MGKSQMSLCSLSKMWDRKNLSRARSLFNERLMLIMLIAQAWEASSHSLSRSPA